MAEKPSGPSAGAGDQTALVRQHAELFDTPQQAVIGTTLSGQIAYWNAAAERLYGWVAEEVYSRQVVDVVPTEMSRKEAEAIMERLRGGRSWAGSSWSARKAERSSRHW